MLQTTVFIYLLVGSFIAGVYVSTNGSPSVWSKLLESIFMICFWSIFFALAALDILFEKSRLKSLARVVWIVLIKNINPIKSEDEIIALVDNHLSVHRSGYSLTMYSIEYALLRWRFNLPYIDIKKRYKELHAKKH